MDNKEAFVLRPLDSTHYKEVKSKVRLNHKGMYYRRPKQTKQTFIDKHENQNPDQELSTFVNGDTREDIPQLIPHVLYRVHQSETEFCDLAFISKLYFINKTKPLLLCCLVFDFNINF